MASNIPLGGKKEGGGADQGPLSTIQRWLQATLDDAQQILSMTQRLGRKGLEIRGSLCECDCDCESLWVRSEEGQNNACEHIQ